MEHRTDNPVRPRATGPRPATRYRAAHAGAAPSRRGGGGWDGAGVAVDAGGQARVRVPGLDGGALRRGAAGDVGRDRHGRPRLDRPGYSHEDEPRAPRSAQRVCAGGPRRGADARRRQSARVPEPLGQPRQGTFLSELLKNLGIAAVPHGFRSSFRDWAAEETDHPREVIEAALAHAVRNQVEAAYARSDLFERRRRLMDEWAAYLAGDPSSTLNDLRRTALVGALSRGRSARARATRTCSRAAPGARPMRQLSQWAQEAKPSQPPRSSNSRIRTSSS